MTPQQKDSLVVFLRWLAPVLVAAGVAWATLGARVESKLDTERFVRDSANKAATLQRIESGVMEANLRLREMACADQRPGCR